MRVRKVSESSPGTSPIKYVRFAVNDIDEDSSQPLGIFQAVARLRDRGELFPYEEAEHDEIQAWFDVNLKKPDRFTVSKPPYYRKQKKAICWFKEDAHEHIARARSLVSILRSHDVSVSMLKTSCPGYVAYEDEFQIAVVPFGGK
jgi:hypothetical protein